MTGEFGQLQQVAVFDGRDPKNLRKVASIDVKGMNVQMHLAGEQLILLTSDASMVDGIGATRIQVYSVADPSNPILQSNLTVTGAFQQSRFADGKLTLFRSNFSSALRPLFISNDPNAAFQMLPETAVGRFETAEEFAARIQTLVVGWMLPDVKAEGSDVDLNVADWSDLVAAPNSSYRHQVSILAFGLSQSGLAFIDSEVLIGATMETSYVDSNTVYLSQSTGSSQSEGTVITNRTALYAVDYSTEEVAFVAHGMIPGTIRDSRMMDEYQGNLRVFSDVRVWNNWNTSSPDLTASSDLYVLRPNAGQLEIIGQLTNVADGQALYSAYFDEAQAMITTWVSEIPNQVTSFPTDPLHAFDLSDPTKPIELSELVIPGVSTYLQRIDNKHLVGIGYVDNRAGEWLQQISLYDVSDLKNLKVVDTWSSSQTSSPNFAGWNQNALAVHFDPQSGLFTVATSAFGTFGSLWLTAFEINSGHEDPLRFLGEVGDETAVALRSAVLNDTLYLISDTWLQTYSTDDLTSELDRELLTAPAVTDSLILTQRTTGLINVLENDRSTGGQVTDISTSKIGASVSILSNGSTIQYEAPDHAESYGTSEQLTYTVTLPDGTSYVGTLYVTIYPIWGPVQPTDPIAVTENVIATVMVVDDQGEAVNTLKQGEEYWIEVQVADGRVNPKGVFAAYVDVQFDTSSLLVVGNVEGIGNFQNGVRAKISENLIASFGAFSNLIAPSNEANSRVARIRVQAQKDGTTHLSATQSQGPSDETLLFGLNNPIKDVSIFTPFLGASTKTAAPTGLAPTTPELYGDLSGDGEISPIDLLLMVDHLNLQSERIKTGASLVGLTAPVSIMDLSGDGEISPTDMMLLVNQLVLLQSRSTANGEESPAAPTIAQASAADDALMSMFAPRYEDQENLLLRSQRTMARA
ncbi:MAG: beta-propeller domain-containing protein [Pirellulaceae bacterium]|nr:beta-propeller domain-containing protein [Pirellulaceae bacterium]